MHNIARLKRALRNPRLFARGVNRLYHRRLGFRSENPAGVDVFSQDWDTLVILDACRYDMFERAYQENGKLSPKQSKGSATSEWLQANIDGRDLSDTVYVTANPQLERNRENWDVNLHETKNIWLDEGWDEDLGTVLAVTVTEAAIDAFKRFPDKRLVVHYMQPHYPFVKADTKYDKDHLDSIKAGEDGADGENIWNQKFMGELEVSCKSLWSMYDKNLEYVLEHVDELLNAVHGKTVVTSDHGNFVGERASPIPIREYGHPRGLYDDPVVRVPWLEIVRGDRRDIQAGTSERSEERIQTDKVMNRLQHLGYQE